ncbi:60S ribosome biogenesis protein Mak11 [Histoplasma capsulatum var. duboisii H88]|uniref:60S ribosome biogenesis protein Mak11 n=1 Tax=Ajellomyces capsulatus (strain H88) TaxID=544711 RepID=F0UIS2_AJEC8|nr:60S ribosome biogenesis protein Mak11 [Histoplasma capsulatum var. duboisii H88]QSS56275.1 60S ribosome biogenesis protein Mak11 [Histoplasma capsulatum var. duboisii H88]
MAKRKRDDAGHRQEATRKALKADVNENGNVNSQKQDCASEQQIRTPNAVTIQIITGSYERILHGITATVFEPSTDDEPIQSVQFVDNFLFQAHASAIKCLALGPLTEQNHQQSDGPQKVMLASGGTDERVNLYTLSASSPPASDSTKFPTIPALAGNKILENPKNRELGSLLHHSSAITALYFPSRSKLLSAAEDNTIAVTRTRDWSVVSTIKVPRPKVQGRPSGDTAPPGGAPAGVNDFAVHPSMKLMLTVGRGEKCMRLWNLVTGRKAGVLNFDRRILESVLEGKYSSGEGRRISWDSEGEEFAVAFERGAVVFGIDSVPTQVLFPSPRTKLHQLKYIDMDMVGGNKRELLAVSTEDGRILFYSTKSRPQSQSTAGSNKDDTKSPIPEAQLIAQLGGKDHGQSSRIKDFEVLPVKAQGWNNNKTFLIVTASSDGAVKLWMLNEAEFPAAVGDRFPGNKKGRSDSKELKNGIPSASASTAVAQVGRLLGTYESSNRITCMKAFVMLAPPTGELDDSDFSGSNEDQDSSGSDGED